MATNHCSFSCPADKLLQHGSSRSFPHVSLPPSTLRPCLLLFFNIAVYFIFLKSYLILVDWFICTMIHACRHYQRGDPERERPAIISEGIIGQRKQKITGLPLVFIWRWLRSFFQEGGEMRRKRKERQTRRAKGRGLGPEVDTLLFLEWFQIKISPAQCVETWIIKFRRWASAALTSI